MLEVGWSEMLVIAIVMIVVVGPKDLPRMLRTFGRTAAKLRQMAGEFQQQFNEALKEAELDDVKKSVDELRSLNPATQIKKQLNPFEKAAADVRAGLSSLKPAPPAQPASPDAQAAEPLKNGAADIMTQVLPPSTLPDAPPVSAAPGGSKAGAAKTPKSAKAAPVPAQSSAKAGPRAAAKATAAKTTAANAAAKKKPRTKA